jgi:heptosyltransferase-3
MAGERRESARRGGRARRAASRVGSALSPIGRGLLQRLLDLVVPLEPNVPLDAIGDVRSILLVRPNFRLGNALITSPLVEALQRRFPEARLDYLGGEGTLSVLDGLPIAERLVMSRGFVLRPWRFVGLFVGLRRRRYDLAIELAMGSFSGGLYAYLSGARHRLGVPRRNERLLDVRLPPTPVSHAYDGPVAFARHLGVACADRPVYRVTAAEADAARRVLAHLGLVGPERVEPFVACFVGGHGAKRWPHERWVELARRVASAGARVVLFAGPEEAAHVARLRTDLAGIAPVVEPQALRTFAALLAASTLVVTPDSGPMHLAAAVGAPVVAVLTRSTSTFFGPRGPEDAALCEPDVDAVVAAVRAHPRWSALAREAAGARLQRA